MLSGRLFQHLNYIAKVIRGSQLPFGGMQLVLSGDFFQLPPVATNTEKKVYAFSVPEWAECVPQTIGQSPVHLAILALGD